MSSSEEDRFPGADADADVATPGADNDNDSSSTPALRPPPRKRRRTVISCTECHRRKQKCDRKLPCTNCISRHKHEACRYESGAPTARELQQKQQQKEASPIAHQQSRSDNIPTKVANFGYSRTGASTLGFLQKLEGTNPDEPLSKLNPDSNQHGDQGFNTRERYKSLIRQLPARTYIDKLIDIYFVEFNWQYQGLDRDVFDKQLAEWYRLPFSLLTTGGPQALSPSLRAFPGLLFQVLAVALLLLHPNSDPVFESLKYAGNMSFEDLAVDYSESGVAILSLLGKRQMTMTTVYGGFLRASFLKYVGMVTEAWHAIGSAIRDGQEIGLHRDSFDTKPKSEHDAEEILENQWEIQRRRRLWITLVSWDIHTGVVLGRPTTIDHASEPPTLPVDVLMIPNTNGNGKRRSSPIVKRTENDPPTPLTRLLFGWEISNLLREVLSLERDGPCPRDFNKVDRLHDRMVALEARTPSYFRLENPDTRFDDLPECYWLPYARAQMPQFVAFNLMALHRPYIFTRPKSRTEALKASLGMLQAQRFHFSTLKPQQYKMFSLFFGTFDAIVLVASIFILFPKEHPDIVCNAIRHFHWAVERFEAMADRNPLVRAALGVLQAIYLRLKKSLGISSAAAKQMLNHSSDVVVSVINELSPNISGSGSGGTPAITVSGSGASPPSGYSGVGGGGTGVGRNGVGGLSPFSSISSSNSLGGEGFLSSGASPTANNTNGSGSRSSNGPSPSTTGGTATNGTSYHSAISSDNNNNKLFNTDTTGGEFDWSLPSNFDWSSVQPIYATGDLLYNDLASSRSFMQLHDGGKDDATANVGDWTAAGLTSDGVNLMGTSGGNLGGDQQQQQQQQQPWLFEGDFANDSVWNLFNQFNPAS
ncbi:hypothetical protein B0H66DRAFT_563550 [Apodospora peruviana]|uniref:Zn(2)-C6 fungal-type domain-containing protein n=1 Tax=Apodospora peruviana TaxID=516989 RepID=A0AAE0HXM6_9PEZI|nr:hypothetical protein B0H66DRAFT_563550 [Apodospora peruviana]